MDAFVYIVRHGPNEELRFSLRSLHQHFPGTPVFIVGNMPSWCQPTGYLPGNHWKDKPSNVWGNLQLAAGWDALPDDIVIMNDDMYITGPVKKIPVLYRGPLADHVDSLRGRNDWWSHSMRHTASLLPEDARSYELHTPFPCSRSLMHETLSIRSGLYPPQWRTLYGNQHHSGRRAKRDVKIARRTDALPTPFASTRDISFRLNRRLLAQAFPDPSPHEAHQRTY